MKRTSVLKTRAVALAAALTLVPATFIAATPTDAEAATPAGAKALAFAKKQIGDPYRFGAAGPNAWDCSGLTWKAYASAGKKSIGGHSATAQYRDAQREGRLRSYANRKAGDLIFYRSSGGGFYHVAIYAGGNKMVESPKPGTSVRLVPVRSGDRAAYVARP